MSTRLRFLLALAGLTAYVGAGLVLLGLGVWSSVGPADQATLTRVVRGQVAFLVVGGVLFVAGLGYIAARFFNAYVVPLKRLAAEARLVAAVNPQHRLDPRHPGELAALVRAVNELAEQYQAAQQHLDERVAADRADLEGERNRLAALMSELALAVVVCNSEGQILLYNAAAQELLGSGQGGRRHGYIGLGRSVFGVVDRDLVTHALDRIRTGAGTAQLATTTPAGRLLRVRVAPVTSADDELGGFILTLEDMTRQAEISTRRDAALRALGEGSRAPLAAIRAAIESVLDYPDMAPQERRRFAEIVSEETHRLSDHLDHTLKESSAYLTDRWLLEDVRGGDLLASAERSIRSTLGVQVLVTEPDSDLWLEVDSHAVVRAVTDLARRVCSVHGVGVVGLALDLGGNYVSLDVGWKGPPMTEEALRGWSDEALVKAVLDQHSGVAWSGTGPTGPYVRLLLPRSTVAGPGRALTPGPEPAVGSRPEFYDFDLLGVIEPEQGGDIQQRLDDLAYTVFDTETTGLNPSEGDEIIAIGAVRIVNGRLLRQETYEQLVDPVRSIPEVSRRIHGITPEMLAGKPRIDEVIADFARFAEGSVLIGHNVAFDLKFFKLKEPQTGVSFSAPMLDTLLLSAVAAPEHPDHSLEAIAARLGVNVLGRHTALGDAILAAEIFVRLLPLLADRGIVTLAQAHDAARRTHEARVSDTLYKRY